MQDIIIVDFQANIKGSAETVPARAFIHEIQERANDYVLRFTTSLDRTSERSCMSLPLDRDPVDTFEQAIRQAKNEFEPPLDNGIRVGTKIVVNRGMQTIYVTKLKSHHCLGYLIMRNGEKIDTMFEYSTLLNPHYNKDIKIIND